VLELAEHILRPEMHSIGPLDERFDHHGSERGRIVCFKFLEGCDVQYGRVMLMKTLKKKGDSSEAGCAEGVSVIGAAE
jgi:hypothetical protein